MKLSGVFPAAVASAIASILMDLPCSFAAATDVDASTFVCKKRSFYTMQNGGVRRVHAPTSMCSTIANQAKILEALCCANTHVICSDEYTAPTLVSYDGGTYLLQGAGDAMLQNAKGVLCGMRMADACSDCDTDRCALFNPNPAPRTCYGHSVADQDDGSGTVAANHSMNQTYTPLSKLCRPSRDGYYKALLPARGAESPAQCRELCSADRRCVAYEYEWVSFETGGRECELHDTVERAGSIATGDCAETNEVDGWRCCRVKDSLSVMAYNGSVSGAGVSPGRPTSFATVVACATTALALL